MRDFSLFGHRHVQKYEETGGKVGHAWNGTQVLIVHAKGRKSGETRKVPLICGRAGAGLRQVPGEDRARDPARGADPR